MFLFNISISNVKTGKDWLYTLLWPSCKKSMERKEDDFFFNESSSLQLIHLLSDNLITASASVFRKPSSIKRIGHWKNWDKKSVVTVTKVHRWIFDIFPNWRKFWQNYDVIFWKACLGEPHIMSYPEAMATKDLQGPDVQHCFYDFCKQTILHGWHYLADLVGWKKLYWNF